MPRKARRFSELSVELVTSPRTPEARAWLRTLSLLSVQWTTLYVTVGFHEIPGRSQPGRLAVADCAVAAVLAVTRNPRQAANNPMITGSDGEGARTRGLRDHLSCPSQPATAAPPVNPVASRLRSAGPLGPSTAAGAAAAFLSPARGYRQRQAGRRPGAELAVDREAVSAYRDFFGGRCHAGSRTLFSPILCIQK